MSVVRPTGLRAGFHASADAEHATGLIHAGEQWAPGTFAIDSHAHTGWELYLQAHGTTSWRVADALRRLAPGDLLAVAPGVDHALAGRPVTNHHFFYAAFDPEALLIRRPHLRSAWMSTARFRHVGGGQRLLAPFQTLVRELSLRLPFARDGLGAALDVLLVEATRLLVAPQAAPILLSHPAVTATQELLDAHYDQQWPLQALAARVGLSSQHLHEIFSRDVGVTPHRYQLEQRMRRAQELVTATDLPIITIAFEIGFGSSQQFSRTYRQQFGTTPRGDRQRARRMLA